jgi:hypothetical protein
MSTLKTTNIAHPSSASNNIVLDSSGNVVLQAGTAGAPAIQTTGDSNTGIYFPTADNIGFTAGGTIRGRWTTDGLCFNADTAAANALDDYEEGTWTPSVGGTATYSTQTGRYTKTGRVVLASFYLAISTIGTGLANRIEGLPFTAAASGVQGGGAINYWNALNTSFVYITPYVYASAYIDLYSATAAAASLTSGTAVLKNGAAVQGFVIYEV